MKLARQYVEQPGSRLAESASTPGGYWRSTRSAGVRLLLLLLGAALLGVPVALGGKPHVSRDQVDLPVRETPSVQTAYGRLSLSFETNYGQADPAYAFLARGANYSLAIGPAEAILVLRQPPGPGDQRLDSAPGASSESNVPSQVIAPGKRLRDRDSALLRIQFVGANPHAAVTGEDGLPGSVNYFIGDDPTRWHTAIPTYQRVRVASAYPGIDVIYYGDQRDLEYDLVIAPGADLSVVRLALMGAEAVTLDDDGSLLIELASGQLRKSAPRVYQLGEDGQRAISGGYVLREAGEVGFEVGAYEPDRPVVIDPTLSYSTYLGGSAYDYATGIAVDSSGNAYIVGSTAGGFPTTTGAYQSGYGGGDDDVFVAKLNPTGTALVYATYLGGSTNDIGRGIAVDSSGNAYVTGDTLGGFPTTPGAYQPAYGGGTDAFVAKLNATGTALLYSTYLGGSNYDVGSAIAVDSSNNAYVTGGTAGGFPTTAGAYQPIFGGGGSDAFVAKLNATGSGLAYSTYVGGSGAEGSGGIAVDGSGNAHVAGSTTGTFPITGGAYQPTFGGGGTDAFVAKLNAAGTALLYSTYLGGGHDEGAGPVAVDSGGNVYLTGDTTGGFPITGGAYQPTFGGGSNDAFVAKLNASGSGLVYSTYLGGGGFDGGLDIAVDSGGNAYVTGYTYGGFPTTPGAFQTSYSSPPLGPADAFLVKLNPNGTALLYGTYLGGGGADFGFGIALDGVGNVYITGKTQSGFPTTSGVYQQAPGGRDDAFVTRFAPSPALNLAMTTSPSGSVITGASLTYTITIGNGGELAATGVTLTDSLPDSVTFVSSSPGCSGTRTITCSVGTIEAAATAQVQIVVRPGIAALGTLTNSATAITDPPGAFGSATTSILVQPGADLSLTGSAMPSPVAIGQELTYTYTVRNNGPSLTNRIDFQDTLPANVTLVSASTSAGTCTAGTTVTCALGGISDGAVVTVTIRVRARPAAGGTSLTDNASVAEAFFGDPNPSNNTISQIVFVTPDTTPPALGALTINSAGGATASAVTTTSRDVRLFLQATDDASVAEMSFSNDGTTFGPWQPFAASMPHVLSSGDGLKTVYARVRDSAGNMSTPRSAQISLDTSVGSLPGLLIKSPTGGVQFTRSTSVNLYISAPAHTAQMLINNDGMLTSGAFEPYASRKPWTLVQSTSHPDERVVYVFFKDVNGNLVSATPYLDTITLDTSAPTGSVRLLDGVSSSAVELQITAQDLGQAASGIAMVQLSTDPAFPAGGTITIPWVFGEGGSTTQAFVPGASATLYARFTDRAENVFTLTKGLAAVVAANTALVPGDSLSFSWSNVDDPTGTTWVGLYPSSADERRFLAGTTVGAQASGTGTFVVPADLPAGAYQLRLYRNRDSGFRLVTGATLSLSCIPTNSVAASIGPASGGRLLVTLTANGGVLQNVSFATDARVPDPNALVDIPATAGVSAVTDASIPLYVRPNAATFSFAVRQASAGRAVTVPLVIADGCGNVWTTLVGSGPDSFAAGNGAATTALPVVRATPIATSTPARR